MPMIGRHRSQRATTVRPCGIAHEVHTPGARCVPDQRVLPCADHRTEARRSGPDCYPPHCA